MPAAGTARVAYAAWTGQGLQTLHLGAVPGAALPAQTSGASRPLIKKRASLCLLRLLRKTPADAPLVVTADTFSPTMGALLEERDLGLLLCSVTLLHGVLQRSGPSEHRAGCSGVASTAVAAGKLQAGADRMGSMVR